MAIIGCIRSENQARKMNWNSSMECKIESGRLNERYVKCEIDECLTATQRIDRNVKRLEEKPTLALQPSNFFSF